MVSPARRPASGENPKIGRRISGLDRLRFDPLHPPRSLASESIPKIGENFPGGEGADLHDSVLPIPDRTPNAEFAGNRERGVPEPEPHPLNPAENDEPFAPHLQPSA